MRYHTWRGRIILATVSSFQHSLPQNNAKLSVDFKNRLAVMRDAATADPSRTPAAQASALLLRVGIALLLIAAPMMSVGSRRAFLIVAPLGISIIFLATMIDGRAGLAFSRTGRFFTSIAGVAALFLLFWAAVSLGWTSSRALGFDRLLKISGTLLLTVLACFSLPSRMRASNLYLIPIGVLLAAGLAIAAASYGLLPFRAFDPDQPTLDRAAAAISLQLFAALGWLMTKERPLMAALLGAVVLFAAFLGAADDSAIAIAAGGLALLAATWKPKLTGIVVAGLMALLLLLAPLLAIGVQPYADYLPWLEPEDFASLDVWVHVVRSDPLRLIAGRGMESAAFDRITGVIGFAAPHSTLFEIWYELGLLGAASLAVLMGAAVLAASRMTGRVAPYAIGALTCAFLHACMGSGTVQTWWMTTLCLTAIAFAAVNSGQYRSVRPRAALFNRTEAEPAH